MSKSVVLPVLPLRNTVMFPGITLPIKAGRPLTVQAIKTAVDQCDQMIFAVAQKNESGDASLENLYSMGVITKILQVEQTRDGLKLVLHGMERGIASKTFIENEGLKSDVSPVAEYPLLNEKDLAFGAMFKEFRERSLELGQQRGVPKEILDNIVHAPMSPGGFTDMVAGYLELPVAEQQSILETLSVEERMRRVLVHVQRQIDMNRAQAEIHSQVEEKLGQRQREVYLREQMKAIQKELGEDDAAQEIDVLRGKLKKLELPKEARDEVDRELNRLQRSGGESMEAQVIRTYLEWIAELPWNTRSDDNLDLLQAMKVLEEDHYGLKDVKDRVLEFLSIRQLRASQLAAAPSPVLPKVMNAPPLHGEDEVGTMALARIHESFPDEKLKTKAKEMAKGPILLFIGPPGVGKSSIAKSIARALNRKFVRISLGGVHDEADIRGHRRTYVGAMPGRIIQGLKQAGTKNPVFLLDEVDKLGVSYQGNPASALLEVLDPMQNDAFTDHYLNVPFDLSEVLFVATANFIQNIPAPLLDRMEVVDFVGYTEREKMEIAKKYLVPRQMDEAALSGTMIRFSEQAIYFLVSHYTHESGVRQLERQIGSLARKIARRVASRSKFNRRVTPQVIKRLLGHPKVRIERANLQNEIGVSTGMYYSPTGGDIMFVEASTRSLHDADSGDIKSLPNGCGKVHLILTGHLGEVMQESARAALTYATSHAEQLGVTKEWMGSLELHLHVPAGAIPKDGPSAGVAMATAIVSSLTRRPVRRDVAMTGEVTLRGRVLPIGGVKEKVLGAHRAGITHILLPKENETDIEDIPKEVRKQLTFQCVSTLDEVFAFAILPKENLSGEKHAQAA